MKCIIGEETTKGGSEKIPEQVHELFVVLREMYRRRRGDLFGDQ
ncbi:hypothetical protein [uncultured Marinobacter sp.]|nr:hypothetical protein [uncultured Marinobacter sp.]